MIKCASGGSGASKAEVAQVPISMAEVAQVAISMTERAQVRQK